MICGFCGEGETERFTIGKKANVRTYARCAACGGIIMEEKSRFCKNDQKKRYELHQNTLTDDGYRAFLRTFADGVFAYLGANGERVQTVFDYGSGPVPCLSELLRLDAENGTYAPLLASAEVRAWDPFFAPDTPFFTHGADLVLCLEVAEHFETLEADFLRLASACKTGGYIAIGTLFLTESTDFNSWWYKDDRTHVCFYTHKALTALALRVGLTPVLLQARLCILRKG